MKIIVKNKTEDEATVVVQLPPYREGEKYVKYGDMLKTVHDGTLKESQWRCTAGPAFLHNLNEEYSAGEFFFVRKRKIKTPTQKKSPPKPATVSPQHKHKHKQKTRRKGAK